MGGRGCKAGHVHGICIPGTQRARGLPAGQRWSSASSGAGLLLAGRFALRPPRCPGGGVGGPGPSGPAHTGGPAAGRRAPSRPLSDRGTRRPPVSPRGTGVVRAKRSARAALCHVGKRVTLRDTPTFPGTRRPSGSQGRAPTEPPDGVRGARALRVRTTWTGRTGARPLVPEPPRRPRAARRDPRARDPAPGTRPVSSTSVLSARPSSGRSTAQ